MKIVMEMKQQSNEKATANTKSKNKNKTKQKNKKNNKLMNILRHNKNLLTDTVKESRKNAMLAKYEANYWLTYERSGKHTTNFKCLL